MPPDMTEDYSNFRAIFDKIIFLTLSISESYMSSDKITEFAMKSHKHLLCQDIPHTSQLPTLYAVSQYSLL